MEAPKICQYRHFGEREICGRSVVHRQIQKPLQSEEHLVCELGHTMHWQPGTGMVRRCTCDDNGKQRRYRSTRGRNTGRRGRR